MSQSKQTLQGLQIARGVAAILVVLHHAADTFALDKYGGFQLLNGYLVPLGRAGVDFFFVLSGFIIYWVHASDIGQKSTLPSYIFKRLSRIFPAYWVVFLIMVALFFLLPQIGSGHERSLGVVLKGFFLVPGELPLLLTVAWTLSHELLFYGLFAALLINKRAGFFVVFLWGAALLVAPVLSPLPYPLNFLLHVRNLEFFIGLGVAVLLRSGFQVPLKVGFGGILIFCATAYFELNQGEIRHKPQTLFYGLGSAMVIAAIVSAEQVKSFKYKLKFWCTLGNASYSIYLVHFPLIVAVAKLSNKFFYITPAIFGVVFFLSLILSIVGGVIFHLYVELPLISFSNGPVKRFFRIPTERHASPQVN